MGRFISQLHASTNLEVNSFRSFCTVSFLYSLQWQGFCRCQFSITSCVFLIFEMGSVHYTKGSSTHLFEIGPFQFSPPVGNGWNQCTNVFWRSLCLIGVSYVALVVKNLLANAGHIRDVVLIPRLGRSTGGGHSNPIHYSCLENPMDRGAWRATVHTYHRVAKSQTRLKWLSTHTTLIEWVCEPYP